MKLPRDIDYATLIKMLAAFGYTANRQTGSHICIFTEQNGQHHITIPAHRPIKIGTLNAILADIAAHFNISKSELSRKLFG